MLDPVQSPHVNLLFLHVTFKKYPLVKLLFPRSSLSEWKFRLNVKWNSHFQESPFGKCRAPPEVLISRSCVPGFISRQIESRGKGRPGNQALIHLENRSTLCNDHSNRNFQQMVSTLRFWVYIKPQRRFCG